jgi:hypothetical protein
MLVCKLRENNAQNGRWFTTDEKRHGSPGPLQNHLMRAHGFNSEGKRPDHPDGPIDRYTVRTTPKDMQEAILNWLVAQSRPFSTMEEPTFIAMMEAAGKLRSSCSLLQV